MLRHFLWHAFGAASGMVWGVGSVSVYEWLQFQHTGIGWRILLYVGLATAGFAACVWYGRWYVTDRLQPKRGRDSLD